MTFGEISCPSVGRRVEVGRDKHIQNPASAGAQPCRDRMTGGRIELLFVAKSGSADVNRYAVEAACLGREILLEILDDAGKFPFGIPEEPASLARSKLTGLWSTTVTLLPERASIVARFPPPQPSRRMFLASPKMLPSFSRMGVGSRRPPSFGSDRSLLQGRSDHESFRFPRSRCHPICPCTDRESSYVPANCDVFDMTNDLT